MLYRGLILLSAALLVPAQAHARPMRVDIAPQSLGDAAIRLARLTGSSIVILDDSLSRQRAPGLRGTFEPEQAIRLLAEASGARAKRTGQGSWRIERRAPGVFAARPAPARRSVSPVPPGDAVAGEPIVVTATKRDLTIDQIAGQVTVLDGASLAAGGVGGSERITRQLATVISTHLGSGRNKLFIRGIADSSFTGPTQATVGQYLGDLRLSYNAPDPDLRLSDLARVEVLEGPQGTLYGAGSLGGIIRLVPNEPLLDQFSFAGQLGASATRHGAPGGDLGATVNLPLVEGGAALRMTVDAAHQGGYIDKPLAGRSNANGTDILSARAMLRIEPAPDWTVDLVGLGQATDSADSQYADRNGPPLQNSALMAEGSRARYAMGQIVVSGRIGALRLRSSTGLVRQDLREHYDASTSDDMPRLFTQDNHTRMFVSETRVWMPERGGIGWLAGANFTHNRTVLDRDLSNEGLRRAQTGVRNTTEEFTLYGEGSLRLAAPLVATAGGRVTWSQLGGAGEDIRPEVLMAFEKSAITAQRTEATVLPSAALHLSLAPHTALYMRYQQGFRPGGLAIEDDYVRRFRSDRTSTFEFGARHGQRGQGPFDLALSLSRTRWEDIQADFIDTTGLPSTANIGDGHIWSASVSAGVLVVPELRLEGALAWNRSRVDTPSPEMLLVAFRASAMQVPNIANVAGRAGLDWDHALPGEERLRVQAWASYVGRSRLGIGPELGNLQGDYLDSGVTVRLGNARRGISASATNLADVRGNRFALGTPFATGREQVTPLRPLTLRIGIDTAF